MENDEIRMTKIPKSESHYSRFGSFRNSFVIIERFLDLGSRWQLGDWEWK
jgi:hypothetical protein